MNDGIISQSSPTVKYKLHDKVYVYKADKEVTTLVLRLVS
jgi:hypothetical protein